jgi:hypothetical protein
MENAMTVFGFGRKLNDLNGQLRGKLAFTVALLPETEPAKIAAHAVRLAK